MHRLRTLLAGETVDFGARPAVPLRDPAAVAVPLCVAATGPRNLRLAGHLGGALVLAGATPTAVYTAPDPVAHGAREAGRDAAGVPFVVAATCLLSDHPESNAQWLKPHALTVAANGDRDRLSAAAGCTQCPTRPPAGPARTGT